MPLTKWIVETQLSSSHNKLFCKNKIWKPLFKR